SGMGDDADNCQTSPGRIDDLAIPGVRIFPNPARSHIQVESIKPFHRLAIYDLQGRLLFRKEYPSEACDDRLDLSLEKGLYFIQLTGQKLLVESKLRME
ncbi:MAG TPA: T9SS type A sorting domain-containing protein, partial [Prolixibacteraceae bacterium]|nr:T9SS type A sorting domain-containing protein [Prolixibacteraceae bacterium]